MADFSSAYDPSTMSDSNPSAGPATAWKNTRTAQALSAAGSSLAQSGQGVLGDARAQAAAGADRMTPMMPVYHRGGTVRASGPARLQKGELVVRKSQARKVRKFLQRRGRSR